VSAWRVPAILAIAVAQLALLAWYLTIPLPNATNIGRELKRWLILAYAVPGFVPGLSWRESHLALAIGELSTPQFLPQRVPMVLAAGLIAGAAVSLGLLVLRDLKLRDAISSRAELVAVAFGLGSTALGVLTLLVGRLGLLGPWPVRAALIVLIATEAAMSIVRRDRGVVPPSGPKRGWAWPSPSLIGLLALVAPFVATMALASMLPTIDFDSLEYHLQGPKEAFLTGRLAFLPHNVYTTMPFGVEMLHLLGMEVMGDWWRGALAGQLLVMLHAPLAAILIYGAAKRVASPRAGWVAAAVYLTTPWVYRLAAIPYVEGPLCFHHAALIWTLIALTPVSTPGPGTCGRGLLLGLIAGGAMACKYTALISAVVPAGAVALCWTIRTRSTRPILTFVVGFAAAVGPWLAKNAIDHQNPVYPLAWSVFGGGPWSEHREAKWSNAHGPKAVSWASMKDGVLDIAGRSDWQSPLYAALAPLALLRRGSSRRPSLWLWGYALYLFGTWYLLTHRLDRFWVPMMPVLAVLAGVGADWVRSRAWTAVLAVVLSLAMATSFIYNSTALAGLNEWTSDLNRLRVSIPERLNAPLSRIDTELPTDARVLLVGQAAVFHLNHSVYYNTVFDDELIEGIARDREPVMVSCELHRLGVTHVYVDWHEIDRHRKPGGYGFTPFVTPELFEGLVRDGVLEPPVKMGAEQDLYRVR
jgi:hypothetical protein